VRDAFDDLEDQLRRATLAQREAHHRRRRGWKRTSAFGLIGALAVAGAAVGAVQLTHGPSSGHDRLLGIELAVRAVRETAHATACKSARVDGHPRLSDATPLPEITRVLPILSRRPLTRAASDTLASSLGTPASGPILRSTVRVIGLRHGLRLVVYVEQGGGISRVRDLAACRKLRTARLDHLLAGHSADVAASARHRLAEQRDTAPGLQTLAVQVRSNRSGGATGIPVTPGQPLTRGLILSSSSFRGRAGLYVCIGSEPDAVRVTARPRLPRYRHLRLAGVAVIDGFYVIALPPHTGPVQLTERDAAGRRLHTVEVRQ
jgi:hypothetical protein